MWHTLRKTTTDIYIEYGVSYTGNLFADTVRAQFVDGVARVSFDLNQNLKTNNRATNTYVDAKDLADGEIAELLSLQCDDDKVITTLKALLQSAKTKPSAWELAIELQGTHVFPVQIKFDVDSLVFVVTQEVKKRNRR